MVETDDEGQVWRVIQPPSRPLLEQLLDYLYSEPEARPRARHRDVGLALAALTVRYGSYYGVLADPTKPVWQYASRRRVSAIADHEMQRINIEASGALEQLLEIWRTDVDWFLDIVARVHAHLPLPSRRVPPALSDSESLILAWSRPEVRALIAPRLTGEYFDERRREAEAAPTRVLANTLVNVCWRNTGIEDVHAGVYKVRPLGQRRVSAATDATLFRTAASGFSAASMAFARLLEEDDADWVEQVLPFNSPVDLLTGMMIPTGWSTTDRSSEVRLTDAEPEI